MGYKFYFVLTTIIIGIYFNLTITLPSPVIKILKKYNVPILAANYDKEDDISTLYIFTLISFIISGILISPMLAKIILFILHLLLFTLVNTSFYLDLPSLLTMKISMFTIIITELIITGVID